MADGYLENQQIEYEVRKANWLRKKNHLPRIKKKLEKPEDDAL